MRSSPIERVAWSSSPKTRQRDPAITTWGTEHLLLGLIREGEGVAATPLDPLGIAPEAVRDLVEGVIGSGAESSSERIPFTPRAKTVLELSLRESL